MTDTTAMLLAPAALPTPYELNNMSTQQLRGELARSITLSARHLGYLAVIWSELEKRGEDLSDLRTGLAAYLPQIAAGRLSADAVLRFAGQPTVLRSIASLPVDQQHKLAMGEPVEVLTVNAAGEYESARMPAYTLTGSQARLVFDGAKLRAPEEQRAIMESVRLNAKRRTRPGPDNRVRVDTKADLLRIGRSSATVGEVVAAIAGSANLDTSESELGAGMVVKLTESEHRMLKARAAEAGTTLQAFVRSVLIKFSAL